MYVIMEALKNILLKWLVSGGGWRETELAGECSGPCAFVIHSTSYSWIIRVPWIKACPRLTRDWYSYPSVVYQYSSQFT